MQSFYSKPLRPMRLPDWDADDAAALSGASNGARATSSSAPPPTTPTPAQPQPWLSVVAAPARGFSLQELRTVSFERWLLALDASGDMARYRAALEEHYDTVSQIAKTYVLSDGTFDDQFYDDVGVSTAAHRERFRDSLMFAIRGEAGALTNGGPSATAAHQRPNGASGHAAPSCAAGSQHAACSLRHANATSDGGAGPAAIVHCADAQACLTFREWLLDCDPSGALLRHLRMFEDSYDSVAQVLKSYVLPSDTGDSVLDPQFFGDLGIEEPSHADMFRQWFHRECGASELHRAACNGNGGSAGGPRISSVIGWLEAHGLGAYHAALEEAGYDDLSLLPRLRPVELDEMLEAVVAKPGHRAKFRHAVEALREGCPS